MTRAEKPLLLSVATAVTNVAAKRGDKDANQDQPPAPWDAETPADPPPAPADAQGGDRSVPPTANRELYWVEAITEDPDWGDIGGTIQDAGPPLLDDAPFAEYSVERPTPQARPTPAPQSAPATAPADLPDAAQTNQPSPCYLP